MRIQIEDIDLGWSRVRRNLKGVDGMTVHVGLFDETNAQKGAWAELGFKGVRPRPWLSIAADSNANKAADMSGKAILNVADGAKPDAAFKVVGQELANGAIDVIARDQVGGPRLADSTIDRKGHDQKLVDSGQMVTAIDYQVGKDLDE